MSYKNKTYVIFDADTDIRSYRLMQAWKANQKIDFNFYDAHDINNLWSRSNELTIKRKLRERMLNTKQVIVLVGENTRNLHRFVRWEMELAIELDLPIVAVNLDNSNDATTKTPPILKNSAYFINVPFEIKKIKYALDNFCPWYVANKPKEPSIRIYNWDKIKLS